MIVWSKRAELSFSELAFATSFSKQLQVCEDVLGEDRSIVLFGPPGLVSDVWGADRRGAGGNGHRPWLSANERTVGAGSPIGGQPSGFTTEDGKKACGGNAVPGEERSLGDTSGSASKGAASVVLDCC